MRTPKPVALSGEGLARVLVATDFSAGAQRAVERAALLPYAEGAEIHLLHVTPAGRETTRARIRSLLDAELRRLRAGLRGSGQSHVAIEVLAVTGSPFEVILRHAERQKSELVVLGRRGWTNLRSLVLGSTAERVVRGRSAPVLVVGAAARGRYRRPLLAVDLERPSSTAIDLGLRIVTSDVERVQVLSAYNVAFEGWMRAGDVNPAAIATMRTREGKRCRAALGQLVAKRDFGVAPVGVLVKSGDPRMVIRDVADRRGVDLLVLGTQARRGLPRFLLGSIAVDVLRSASSDVLMVPPERA